jgi:hypothetical protein
MSTTMAENNSEFGPQQAAALLNQTTRQARRQLEPHPPWLLATRAAGALLVYGSLWLSVRGQHPYMWPTAAAAPGAIAFGLLNTAAVVAAAKRATAGVSGRSPVRRTDIAMTAAVMVGVFAVMGVLISAGVSHAIVYGIYPAAVPLIAGGLTWAGLMAARASWRECGTPLASAAVGVAALFAGPAGAWLVAGVGVFAVLLASAVVVARRQRAA